MILTILLSASPPDFLQNPVFQFTANAIIAIAAIVVTSIVSIWIYKRQQRRKELSYDVISEAPVISIRESVANRVKVEFDGQPVKEVTLVVLKVMNTGNTAIKKDDYEEPLAFVFKGRGVVSSEVVETEPDDLIDDTARKIFLQVPASSQEFLEFPKFLLNPKQSITFSVLLDGSKGEITKRGRIVDGEIKQVQKSGVGRGTAVFNLIAGLAVVVILIISSIYGNIDKNSRDAFDFMIIRYIFIVLFSMFAAIQLLLLMRGTSNG
jgi:hypothetical protein